MKHLILIFFLILGSLGVTAQQTLHSSYFLKRMPMRHKLNPALINDYGYFSIPVLGNIHLGIQSGNSIKDFLYPTADDNLMTFMHKDVPADKFLNKIKDYTSFELNLDLSVLSFGFFGFKGYNTFDISLRSTTGLYIPKELFRFMKLGMDNQNGNRYHLENFTLQTNNYVEMALGHAHPINEKLTIGAKVKFLAGLANAKARIDRMDITMTQDKWEIMANGAMNASFYGAHLKTKENGEIDDLDFDMNNPALSGWGLGLDLGATYRLLDRLTLSAGLVDLGFIRWNKNLKGLTRNNESFIFDGFTEVDVNDDKDLDDQLDDITDQLEDMIRFYETAAPANRTTRLFTTLNLGAEYTILNDKISFGLLSSTRFSEPKIWTEITGAANFRPASWFNVAFTGTLSNYGPDWGWVLNLCPRGFNFFIGTDHMVTRVTPQFIPTKKATVNLNMGLNIPMGGPRRHKEIRQKERRKSKPQKLAVSNEMIQPKTDPQADSLQKIQQTELQRLLETEQKRKIQQDNLNNLNKVSSSDTLDLHLVIPPKPVISQPKEDDFYTYVPGMKDDGLSWVLRNRKTIVYQAFELNGTDLNASGKELLKALCHVMQKNKTIHPHITVFCDAQGTPEINEIISRKRAGSIERFLVSQNIPVTRIAMHISGCTPPRIVTTRDAGKYKFLKAGTMLTPEYIRSLSPAQQKIAHQLNRRIEIRL